MISIVAGGIAGFLCGFGFMPVLLKIASIVRKSFPRSGRLGFPFVLLVDTGLFFGSSGLAMHLVPSRSSFGKSYIILFLAGAVLSFLYFNFIRKR